MFSSYQLCLALFEYLLPLSTVWTAVSQLETPCSFNFCISSLWMISVFCLIPKLSCHLIILICASLRQISQKIAFKISNHPPCLTRSPIFLLDYNILIHGTFHHLILLFFFISEFTYLCCFWFFPTALSSYCLE